MKKTFGMFHKLCGGVIKEEERFASYSHPREDGTLEKIYPSVCQKCGDEITGDVQIDYIEETKKYQQLRLF